MKLTKSQIYDRMHRAGVISMLALTGAAAVLLTVRSYKYFTVTRPMRKEQQRMLAEEKMQQEQLESEAELVRRQREAEKLV